MKVTVTAVFHVLEIDPAVALDAYCYLENT